MIKTVFLMQTAELKPEMVQMYGEVNPNQANYFVTGQKSNIPQKYGTKIQTLQEVLCSLI